jgi:cytoskeletal protein CcmA (bactofilin family)
MFSKKENDNSSVINQVTIIGKDVQFLGDLRTKDDIRVEGNITGCIISESRVIVGPMAHIFGPIEAISVDVLGVVIGDVKSKSFVKIGAGAVIEGDVEAQEILVEPGAKVYGYFIAQGKNGETFQKKKSKNELSNLTLGENKQESIHPNNSNELLDVISKKVFENSQKSNEISNDKERGDEQNQNNFW